MAAEGEIVEEAGPGGAQDEGLLRAQEEGLDALVRDL